MERHASAPTTTMTSGVVVTLLALLLGLQAVASDLYLPGLPQLTQELGANMRGAQYTLSGMLLAFGLSQLIWGPLSDRFGRRPVLLAGLGGFALASIGGTLAPSIEWLIGWRALQGAAMGAAVMGARAIVRDLYAPAEGARVLSKALTGLGVIACCTGPTGAVVVLLFGWRGAIAALGVFSAAALALVAWRFKETLPAARRSPLHPLALARASGQILGHRGFQAYLLLTTATYLGLFTFLAASSFVFIRVLGLSRLEYGFIVLSQSLAYIVGTFWCRRLLPRFGAPRAIRLAGFVTLAGGTLVGVLAWLGQGQSWYGAWAIIVPFWLFMIGHGVHQPCGQAGVVGPFPDKAGMASALNGCGMMFGAFGMGTWLGTHLDGSVFPLTQGLWLWSVLTALIAWTLVQWHGAHGAT